jgi:alkylhydroperoxidase/carboxymuconolactone decarboxylase family protein YurZ
VTYDDETLMAFADGELDQSLRAEIAVAIERDPALAGRVAQHRALRAKVAGAFSTVLDRPVPDNLIAIARGAAATADANRHSSRDKVLQFPAPTRRAPAMPWRAREWAAMAASVVLGVVMSWKLIVPDPPLIAPQGGRLVARGALAAALDQQLASKQSGLEPVLIGLSFRTGAGNYCRSFALARAASAGLACRSRSEWEILATAPAPPAVEGVRQAGSPSPAIMQAIESRISGEALDAVGEQNARRAGWDSSDRPR